jgi:hypothetical protein
MVDPARQGVGFFYLLTVTSPGDKAHYFKSGKRCECTPVGGVNLAEWNASHSRRWNHLRTSLRRDHPGMQFMRGVEVQTANGRGALHDHAMVWSPTALKPAAVKARAMAAGFGHEMDLTSCVPGSRKAAYYVSKYVTKATDVRESVPWAADVVDITTGEVTRKSVPGRYRTWSKSREWGLRMSDVMAEARAYAQSMAERDRAVQLDAALVVIGDLLAGATVLDDPG